MMRQELMCLLHARPPLPLTAENAQNSSAHRNTFIDTMYMCIKRVKANWKAKQVRMLSVCVCNKCVCVCVLAELRV